MCNDPIALVWITAPKSGHLFAWLTVLTGLLCLALVLVGAPQVELRVFFYPTAQAVANGSSPWADGGLSFVADRNLNSPFGTLLLLPFAWFSLEAASVVLGLLLVALSMFAAWRIAKYLNLPTGLAVAIMMLPPAALHALAIGQMTPLILLLLVLGIPALSTQAKASAAIYLGVACGLKLFVGVVVLPMLIWRLWRSLGWFVLGGLITAVIGALAFGIEGYVAWWEALRAIDWYHHAWNISVVGWGHRLGFEAFSYAAILGILALSSIAIGRLRTDSSRAARSLAILAPCMVLCSPLGWSYYQPLAALTVLVGISERWTIAQLALAATPLLLYPSWGYGARWDTLAATVAMLLCWALAVHKANEAGEHPSSTTLT